MLHTWLFFLISSIATAGFFYQAPTGYYQNTKSLQLIAGSVDCGHEAALAFEYNQKWAVSVWFKAGQQAITNCNLVAHMNNDAFAFRGWRMRVAGTTLTVQMNNSFTGGLYNQVQATLATAADGGWHHLAVNYPDTQNASDIKVFYDGVQLSTTVNSNTLGTNSIVTTDAPFHIGALENFQLCSDNDINIDEVQIYGNHTFTTADIAVLYNAGRGGTKLSTTLTSWFKLGDAGDTTASVIDSAGGASGCTYSAGNDRDFEKDVAPVGFNPRQISGIYAWYDASDLNGNGDSNAGYSDGNDVSAWVDKVQGLATQASSGHDNPVIKNNIKNSKPVVRFDGTDDCLEIADNNNLSVPTTGLSVMTIVNLKNLTADSTDGNAIWAKDDDSQDPQNCVGGSNCQREYGLLNSNNDAVNWYVKCDLNSEPDPQVRKISTITTGWGILTNGFNGGVSHTALRWWKNLAALSVLTQDTLGTCSTTQLNGSWPFQLGCRNRSQASGTSHTDMDVAEMIIYRSELTDADVYQLNEYFNNKWAVY